MIANGHAIQDGLRAFLLTFTLCICGVSQAQEPYPVRAVRIVVPNAAGGPSDLVGRILAQKFSEIWNQPAFVDNRPGAGGTIGADVVAKAAPDGYTLLVTNSAPIVVNQSLYARIPYAPEKDLAPVSLLASAPMVLAIPGNSPIRSVTDLVKVAASRPRSLNFASLGNGTASHLAAEMFKAQANVDLVHVPYRSVPQTLAALMVGEIDVFFDVPSILTHVTAGKLKALAVTGRARTALAPQLPTLAESGFPDFEMIAWYGVLAPAGLSPERQAKLHADIVRVLADPAVKVKLNAIGFEIVGNTSGQFAAHIKSESARWAALIMATGLRAE